MREKMSLNRALTLLAIGAILCLIALIAMMGESRAAEWKWQHFGADPYAVSRDAAMKSRESAFRKLGFSASAISLLMEETKKPGEKVRLKVDDRLSTMLSRDGVVHKNVVVAFGSPVKGMEYAAPAEEWQVKWEGRIITVILPEVCYNWSLALSPVVSAPAGEKPFIQVQPSHATAFLQFAKPVGAILACPDVYTLKVNVWERKAIALPGVERTHAKEELAKRELDNRFVGVPHVSRTHGGQFRKAYANGEIKRSAIAHSFRVSLIMTPEATGGDSIISSEEVLGDITVTGLLELQFTKAQLEQWDTIRLVPIENGGILFPPRSGITGLHELRFFNHLPGKKMGKWENNPVPDCIMNEHWIEN